MLGVKSTQFTIKWFLWPLVYIYILDVRIEYLYVFVVLLAQVTNWEKEKHLVFLCLIWMKITCGVQHMFHFYIYIYWLTVIMFAIHTDPACSNLFSIFIRWYESNADLWYLNICCIQSKSLEKEKCAAWCEIRFICRFYRLNKNIEDEKRAPHPLPFTM
jgi:hypothetical protein